MFGDLRKGEWRYARHLILQTLNPGPEDKAYKAVQRILTRIAKKTPVELSEEEQERWFSERSLLELMGLAALNSEDSGGLYALHAHLNHSCDPNLAVCAV